jgi:hypothetical protein
MTEPPLDSERAIRQRPMERLAGDDWNLALDAMRSKCPAIHPLVVSVRSLAAFFGEPTFAERAHLDEITLSAIDSKEVLHG